MPGIRDNSSKPAVPKSYQPKSDSPSRASSLDGIAEARRDSRDLQAQSALSPLIYRRLVKDPQIGGGVGVLLSSIPQVQRVSGLWRNHRSVIERIEHIRAMLDSMNSEYVKGRGYSVRIWQHNIKTVEWFISVGSLAAMAGGEIPGATADMIRGAGVLLHGVSEAQDLFLKGYGRMLTGMRTFFESAGDVAPYSKELAGFRRLSSPAGTGKGDTPPPHKPTPPPKASSDAKPVAPMSFERKLAEVRRYFERVRYVIRDQSVAEEIQVSLNRTARNFREKGASPALDEELAGLFAAIEVRDPNPKRGHIPYIDFPKVGEETARAGIEGPKQKVLARLNDFEARIATLKESLIGLFRLHAGNAKLRESLNLLESELSGMRSRIKADERLSVFEDVTAEVTRYENEYLIKLEKIFRLLELSNRNVRGKKPDPTRDCAKKLIGLLCSTVNPLELFAYSIFIGELEQVLEAGEKRIDLDPESLASINRKNMGITPAVPRFNSLPEPRPGTKSENWHPGARAGSVQEGDFSPEGDDDEKAESDTRAEEEAAAVALLLQQEEGIVTDNGTGERPPNGTQVVVPAVGVLSGVRR